MVNKFWINIIVLIGAIFFCITSSAKTGNLILKSEPKFIKTAYMDLILEERRFSDAQRGRGGVITIVNGNIVMGKSDATFVKINPSSWEYENNYLPALVTGENDLKNSKRYKHKELLPRVEGLIFDKGTYYVTYTRYSREEDLIYFVVAKIKSKNKSWTKIYESPGLIAPYYTLGIGGKMAVKEGKLFFTVGDFSLDRVNGLTTDIAPQNTNLPWGKINYINLKDGTQHPYTIGHRNPLGLVFLKDGTLLSTENGPQGGDEINVIKEGLNYGWPYESFGTNYGGFTEYKDNLPKRRSSVKYEAPIYAFVPSPALSEVIQISGFNKKWSDDLLVGSLKAMTLFHIKLKDNRVIFVEPINIGYRIRSLSQMGHELYVLTDDGTILKITKDSPAIHLHKRILERASKWLSKDG
jgi:hypothetical protein